MEFSIGIPPPRVLPPRPLRDRERRATFDRTHQKKYCHARINPPTFDKGWLLLNHENWVLTHHLNTIATNAVSGMIRIRKDIKKYEYTLSGRPYLFVPPGEEIRFLKEGLRHLQKNQRLINAFRALSHRWLRRRFKPANEEDLCTCEIPRNPVSLCIWSQRTIFNFEANTIRRDMIERIFTQSYLFPKYYLPRNPYTNSDMTENQFYSVVRQLRKAGFSHWVFEALFECQYDLDKFKEKFGVLIRKEIIEREFKKPSGEVLYVIQDFMESHHEKNNKKFIPYLYRWATSNLQNHTRIKSWIQLCKDHHIILYTDGNGKEYTAERNRIDDVAKRLCDGNVSELMDLYDAAHPEDQTCIDVASAAIREAAEAPFTFTGVGTASAQRNVVWDSGSIRIIVDVSPNDDTTYILLNHVENTEAEITLDGFWPDD